MPYVYELDSLDRIAERDADAFCTADPYPHLIVDDFLRGDCARHLAQVFPKPNDVDDVADIAWDRFGADGFEVKFGSADEAHFPAPLRNAIHDLNAGPFLRFLEKLTGIDHLLPDPHLVGGGIHLTRRGGHLGIHADFNWHERLQAHRRLNVLIYLTPDWRDGYGGELELWDTGAKALVRRVEPLFNRMVVFATRSDTFHGHPRPWQSDDVDRQSIALYYYTTQRPESEMREAHSTLYKGYHVE